MSDRYLRGALELAHAQVAALRGALLRAAKTATCCPALPAGEHDPEHCVIAVTLADDDTYACGQAMLRRVKERTDEAAALRTLCGEAAADIRKTEGPTAEGSRFEWIAKRLEEASK